MPAFWQVSMTSTIVGYSHRASSDRQAGQQISEVVIETFGQLAKHRESDIPFAAFDCAHVGPINSCMMGKLLLRKAQGLSPLPHPPSQLGKILLAASIH